MVHRVSGSRPRDGSRRVVSISNHQGSNATPARAHLRPGAEDASHGVLRVPVQTNRHVTPLLASETAIRREMQRWVRAFDDWYFGEVGGMFLSDKARQASHDALEVMAAVSGGPPDATLTEAEIERPWRAGQPLRRTLAADVGAAEVPHLPGPKPTISPPPTTRFRIQDSQEAQEHVAQSARGPGGPVAAKPLPDTGQVSDV